MSYLFSKVLVEAHLPRSCSGGEPFAELNVMPTQHPFLHNAKTTAFLSHSQYGLTCRALTAQDGEAVLMSYLGDSPVRICPQPEQTTTSTASSEDLTGLVRDYGSKLSASLKRYNLDMCCLRTPQTYGRKDSDESWQDLPVWGMMLDGECWGFASSVRTTPGSECSSSLPTPTCHNAKEGAYPAEYTRKTPTLAAQIGGKVNPEWNEYRMGWPIGWSGLEPLVTDKFRQWLQLHSEFSEETGND